MSSHPINLAIRFLLEISALVSAGMWGWRQSDGWLQYIFAFGVPIILAAIWGIFAVPNDPSRSGNAPVPTPGVIRLVIELVFFAFAAWALYQIGFAKTGYAFAFLVVVHYLVSYVRIKWLINH